MFTRVQIHHELDKGAFQSGARAGKTNETATAKLRRALEIKELVFCAEGKVIERIAQWRLHAPLTKDWILARIFSDWHAGVRQVGNLQKQIVLLSVSLARLFVQERDVIANLPNAIFEIGRIIAPAAFAADLLAQLFSLAIERLQCGLGFA